MHDQTPKQKTTDSGFNSTSFGIKTFKSLPNFCNISTRNAIRFTLPPPSTTKRRGSEAATDQQL